jgi:ATP-dependent Clp protease ATP-binding subunit ClpA
VLDRYSDEARRVVALAGSESEALGHRHIGTEHLLLGILADGEGPAAAALDAAGATLAAARPKVMEAVGKRRPETVPGDLPLTARAKRVLERATRFSLQRRSPEIETDHILLAILNVEGTASQVLRGLAVDLNALQDAVAEPNTATRAKPHAVAKPRAAATKSRAASPKTTPRRPDPTPAAKPAASRTRKPAPSPAPETAPEPRCPACGAPLTSGLLSRLVPTRGDAGQGSQVTLVFCGRCGSALGIGGG